MVDVVKRVVQLWWRGEEVKPTWPEPPIYVSLSVFAKGALTPYMDVPVPCYMTADDITVFFGLFFCRHLAIKVEVLGGVEAVSINKAMGQRTIVQYSRHGLGGNMGFLVSESDNPNREISKHPADVASTLIAFHALDFYSQINGVQKLFKQRGLPHQGLEQLARAVCDGYFPLEPATFSTVKQLLKG